MTRAQKPSAPPEEILAAVAERWEDPIDGQRRSRLLAFFRLLVTWNERINLTGAGSVETLLEEHLPDVMAMRRLVPEGARVIDVGAGGGLPGLPFAILSPQSPVTLVEPRAKRIAFLRTAARELAPHTVEVIGARLETVGHRAHGFDVAASRATFSASAWLRLGLPLVGPGGRVLVFAARPEDVADIPARLIDEVTYATHRGHPRWLGAFCST